MLRVVELNDPTHWTKVTVYYGYSDITFAGYRLSFEFFFMNYIVSSPGQVFARRALAKINELGKLEKMSGFPTSPETRRAFKDATIKVCMKLNFK